MENKSKERKWRMKAVKEKLQIFSMLKRPSEMENVPQKITLRDKLTLSSQILTQTLTYESLDHIESKFCIISIWQFTDI